MRHRDLFFGFLITGVLAAGSGCSQRTVAETQERSGEPATTAVDRVTAGTPERKTLTFHTSQPGRIEAFEETPLYPKIHGYVEEILVDIGDPVERGQVLVRLWVPEMQDELDQRQALLAQAQAEVHQAEAAVRAAEAALRTIEAQVSQAEGGVKRADAEYQRWKSEHDRISELAAGGSVTRKLVDETLNQFRASAAARQEAAAQVTSAKAAVYEAQANIEKAKADAEAARARVQVAEANLAHSKTMLAYAEVNAPFRGIVTHRYVDTGHYVQPMNGGDARPLVVIARADKVRVFVDVPEMEAALVNPGDPATVYTQALRGEEIAGTVTRTSWALDQSNRSLRTEIDLPNEDGRLRPGMYATAEIELALSENALTVPVAAIVRDERGACVCCVESGTIARRPVTLGLVDAERVEVLSGLTGEETVVLARADALREGQSVEVIQSDPQ